MTRQQQRHASKGTYRLVWACDQAVLVSEGDRLTALEETPRPVTTVRITEQSK